MAILGFSVSDANISTLPWTSSSMTLEVKTRHTPFPSHHASICVIRLGHAFTQYPKVRWKTQVHSSIGAAKDFFWFFLHNRSVGWKSYLWMTLEYNRWWPSHHGKRVGAKYFQSAMNVQCQARPRFINHASGTYPTTTLYLQRVTKNFVSLLLKCTFGAHYFAHNFSAQSVAHNHSHSFLFHTWLLARSFSHSESLHSTFHTQIVTHDLFHAYSPTFPI